MSFTTYEKLVLCGKLLFDESNKDKNTHLAFYVHPDFVVMTPTQRDDKTWCYINYAELLKDDDGFFWVVHLEGLPDHPNTYKENSEIHVRVFHDVTKQ